MIHFDPNLITLFTDWNRVEKSGNYYTNFDFVDVTVVVKDCTQTIIIILASQSVSFSLILRSMFHYGSEGKGQHTSGLR